MNISTATIGAESVALTEISTVDDQGVASDSSGVVPTSKTGALS